MKVICRRCKGLIKEDDAIKMSIADYQMWMEDISFASYHDPEHSIFTQVCELCWDSLR